MKKLAKYLKPYKFKIFLTLLFTFINVLSTMYLPSLMSKIVNEGVIHGETSVIMKYGIYMIFVTFIGGLVMIGAAYLSSEIATNVGRQIRRDVFTKVERYTLDQVNHFGVATLMTRTTTDINQLQDLLIMGLRMMARSPLMFIGGVIMAVQASPRLSMTLLIALPVIALFIIAVGKKGMPLFKIVQKKVDKLNRVVRENVTGIRVIRAFDKQEYEMQRFEEANRDLRDTNLKINKIMSFLFPGIFFILDAIIILVIYFATSQIDAGLMEVGDLMAFVQYITMILFSIIMLSMIFVMVPRAQVSANRVNEVLEMDDKTKERAGTKKVPENMCSLEFDDVSFKYDNAENCTLENLNFKVKAG
ncbi:MAG: ABC transporter ATP-binding protein, partial [Tissierellia bacterium]|nr:ABC transporter ATP-binding protein [Tissierellia bacterium]